MNAKHLSKFSISKMLALFVAIIAIAIIVAISICATTQANAQDDENVAAKEKPSWILNGNECQYIVTGLIKDKGKFSGQADLCQVVEGLDKMVATKVNFVMLY